MQVGGATRQVARKCHVCWWCGEPIEPGTTYDRWLWKDGGSVFPTKVHCECKSAWRLTGAQDVEFAEFARGCSCQRGCCECSNR